MYQWRMAQYCPAEITERWMEGGKEMAVWEKSCSGVVRVKEVTCKQNRPVRVRACRSLAVEKWEEKPRERKGPAANSV